MLKENLIDVDSALARVGGNMELYKRLLAKYLGGNYITQIDDCVAAGDVKGAAAIAHSIKGVAANLSLLAVKDAAQNAEQALLKSENYNECVENLREAHNATLVEIGKL